MPRTQLHASTRDRRQQCSRHGALQGLLRGILVGWISTSIATFAAGGQTQSAADLTEARRLLDTPNWKDAEPLVRSELDKNAESLDAHTLLGLILYRKHQPRASMAEYVEASKLGDLSAYDLRIFALDCAAIPDLPEAEKWLVRAIAKDEKDAANWEALGHVRFAQQQYSGAIDALTHMLELAPHTVSAQSLIGLSRERMAQLEEAQAAYKLAIEWQNDSKLKDPVPFVGLGRVLLAKNENAKAIPWLQRAVAVHEPSTEAYELLGLAYSRTGRSAEAAAQLEMSVRLDPSSARLHLMLARVYRAMGDEARAEAEQAEYTRLKTSSAQ